MRQYRGGVAYGPQKLPTLDGARFEFYIVADNLIVPTMIACPKGQRQAPIAFLADHPIMHVAQPIQLALQAERWDPADFFVTSIMS
jgi:serine protease inhibitor ecotin